MTKFLEVNFSLLFINLDSQNSQKISSFGLILPHSLTVNWKKKKLETIKFMVYSIFFWSVQNTKMEILYTQAMGEGAIN